MADQGKEYGICANVIVDDRVFRVGGKVWLVRTHGQGSDRYPRIGLNHQGRTVEKWVRTFKLANFRPKWIPRHISECIAFGPESGRGDKPAMEQLCAHLNSFAAAQRAEQALSETPAIPEK